MNFHRKSTCHVTNGNWHEPVERILFLTAQWKTQAKTIFHLFLGFQRGMRCSNLEFVWNGWWLYSQRMQLLSGSNWSIWSYQSQMAVLSRGKFVLQSVVAVSCGLTGSMQSNNYIFMCMLQSPFASDVPEPVWPQIDVAMSDNREFVLLRFAERRVARRAPARRATRRWCLNNTYARHLAGT